MATEPLTRLYRVSAINEAIGKDVNITLVQHDPNAQAMQGMPYPPPPGTAGTIALTVDKDKAGEYLPGKLYSVSFTPAG